MPQIYNIFSNKPNIPPPSFKNTRHKHASQTPSYPKLFMLNPVPNQCFSFFAEFVYNVKKSI